MKEPPRLTTGKLSAEQRQRLEALRARRGRGREGEGDGGAPPLLAVPRGRDLPLSYAQQRFWLMHQMDAGASQALFAYRIRGPLFCEALRRAFEEVVRRHEVLRTTFPAPEGVPYQRICDARRWELPLSDLRDRDAAGREAALTELARELAVPRDLERGPLLRTRLARLGDEEHALVLAVSHLVFDVGSLDIFWSEVRVIYDAIVGGREIPLPPLAIQYADYAAWEQGWIRGDELERRLTYWRKWLAGAPAETALPFKKRRVADASAAEVGAAGAGLGFLRVDLDAELVGQLRALGQRQGATLFMVLLAGFRALMFRYTGQGDLCFGTLIANRSRRELEGAIGLFLNTLVLRSHVEGELTYLDLLAREKDTALEAFAHQETPFELIANALAADRAATRSPLFHVLFSLESAGPGKAELSGLVIEPLTLAVASSPATLYDLTVDVWDHGEVLGIGFTYQAELFAPQDFEQFAGHYVSLLRAVVAEPGRRLVEVPLLSESERHEVLHAWNATERAIAAPGWVHEQLEAQVDRTPEAVAVQFEGESLSYRELDERSNRLAHYLRAAGVGVDQPVAVLLERSLELVVAVYGIVKAGAAFLPIDPSYPRPRIQAILEDAGATRVVGQARFAAQIEGLGAEGVWLDRDHAAMDRQPSTRPAVALHGENLAYVLFTSGSTGRPKGVMNSHGGLRNRLQWMQEALRLGRDDVVLQKTPLTFDVAVWELFWPLVTGARLVVARPEGHRDPSYLGALLQAEQITTLHFVPSMLEAFLAAERPDVWRSVRRVICSGEALMGRHVAQFFRSSGAGAGADAAPELLNLYGPTEAAIDVSLWRCRRDAADAEVPIGRAVANTRLYVLDGRLEPVPAGAIGELYIAGVQLARGYLGRPDLTAERFVPDPHGAAGGRMYRTGDLVRARRDGTLEFLGRIDHQVKLRGFRIELGELESVLAGHPAVRECVVAVRADAGRDELVAYVVPAAGELDAAAVREHLRARLPEYMVPAVIVALAQLPRTSSGKLDRRALPAPAAHDRRGGDFVAPRTAAERTLSELWCQLLRVERIGAADDFFDIGGHSLLAVQLADRIRRTTGHVVPLPQLFSNSVLSEMARLIEARPRAPVAREEVPVPRLTGLTRCRAYHQQEIPWRLSQLAPDNPFAHLATTLRFAAGVEHARMERALHALAARHSILRSVYQEIDGALLMEVKPPEPPWLPSLACEDLSQLSDPERERRAAELVSSFQARAFDLARGPVIRALIIQLAGRACIFSVVTHHIACDARSSAMLADELLQLYTGLATPGATAEAICGPAPLQYIDFASYFEELGRSAEGQRQIAYWHQRMRGAEPPRLPGVPASWRPPARRPGDVWARPAEAVQAFLQADVSARVDALTREQRVTRYMALLAGLAVSLHTATGQRELCFHSSYMQRFRPGLDTMIGFMANSLLMRVGVDPARTFRELLGSVREIVLGAYEHGEVAIRPQLPPELLRVNFNYADNAAGAMADRDLAARRGSDANQVEWYAPGASDSASPARIWIPFDLLLLVTELREGVALTLSYNRELLDADHAGSFLRHYVATLTELCARPDVPVGTASSTSTGTSTSTDAARAASSGRTQDGALRPLPRPIEPPLSFAQERMWFLHQLEPQGTAYNMPPIKRRLVGPLDASALRDALEDLVRRHEALRTVFPSVDGAPRQQILEPAPPALPLTDLRGLRGRADREAELLALIGQEQLRPFDLAHGPLLRAHLYRMDDDEHVLVIILHHIVSDGWSLAVLWRELGALYAARQRGAVADLPPLPVQYADYAIWQRAHLSGERLAKQLGYWIERLAGAPAETALPYRPGSTGWTSSRGASVSIALAAERWRRLRELGRGHRASPFVTLLAAFRALLARRGDQDDLCIGTPISSRDQAQVRGLIGCFVNTVVLRTRVDREAGFSALLAAERRTVLSALAHQQAPFEALVAALGNQQRQRSRGRTPLFQVLFALQDLAWEHEDFGGLAGRPVPLPTQSAQVELAIHVFEQRDQLVICFDYAADRFESAAIEGLARDYVSVLEHVTADPEQALAHIPLEGDAPC